MEILYFTAAWCSPCRTFKPVLIAEAAERGLVVATFDIDTDLGREAATREGVMSVPTVILREGRRERLLGAVSKGTLRDAMDEVSE